MDSKKLIGDLQAIGNLDGSLAKSKNLFGDISIPQTAYVKELEFTTHYEFPAIGDSNTLYIATDENKIYRFDSENRIYICLTEYGDIIIKLKEE
jgi:hypothetical protein